MAYIAPGKPTQNGFIESFNGKLRGRVPQRAPLRQFAGGRRIIEEWRTDYNTLRPQHEPERLTPNEFAGTPSQA